MVVKEIFKKRLKEFQDDADADIREGNETFRELVRQLILVATLFLSVSLFVFNDRDFIKDVECLLILAWIFLISSLIFGIIQIFIDYFHFSRWSKAKLSVVNDIANGLVEDEKEIDKLAEQYQKGIPYNSSTTFVWLQVIFIALAIFILFAIVIRFLL